MKTGKWLILILILVLLAVYYLIGSDYLKQRRHNVSLAAQIAAANEALVLIPSPPADLEGRLAAARDNLLAAESSFTADTNDTSIVNTVLRWAEDIGVKAIPLDTAPWVTENFSGRDYAVFRVNLEATGTFNQLLSYLDRLEKGEATTMIVEFFSVEQVPDLPADVSADNITIPLTANIKIAIYALHPAPAKP